ncbi:MAG TPA: DUF2062 domain-containing protein [Chthoniobacterales bacterium]|nr:DUF2062 domain-containing protein [Chthoniobacterales bacterium]
MPDPSPGEKQTNGGQGTSSNPWQRLKGWLQAHHLTLMTLPDTPHGIALGSAIGMFFGFTPLFGLKTLLSFGGAWLCKGNKTAAVITVTLHDVLLPFVPAIFLWQYKLGMLALSGHIPQRQGFRRVPLHDYMEWTTFFTVGRPILIGSLFFALPAAVVVYFGLRGVLIRARQRAPETPE